MHSGRSQRDLSTLDHIINFSEKTNWSDFTKKEKKMTENLVLLVGFLYRMCKINLVIKKDNSDALNKINKEEAVLASGEAAEILEKIDKIA